MCHNYDLKKILDHVRTSEKKKLIIDTDTYNEVDDQFAVAYALLSDDIDVLALTAAPFSGDHGVGPAQGMELSYQELLRVRGYIDPENKRNIPCYRGSTEYMKNIITPIKSEAAESIVRTVKEADDIVYIATIGCFSNVASALLLDPSIMDKAVIVMIGTQAFDCLSANDTNVGQDQVAARIIFECGIPVIVLPVFGSTAKIQVASAEICYFLENQSGEIGNFLCKNVCDHHGAPIKESDGSFNSVRRGLVDIAAVAFLRGTDKMMQIDTVPAHSVDSNGFWRSLDEDREMLYVPSVNAPAILADMYNTLRNAAKK